MGLVGDQMATSGYVPSRDQMASIVHAARGLYRSVRRWQRDAHLPGYPIERGSAAALESMFHLERALNPGCFAWADRRRNQISPQCWPVDVGMGVIWLRNLLDLVLDRNQAQALASVTNWSEYLTKTIDMPQVILIEADELQALGLAIRRLPKSERLPELIRSNQPSHMTNRRDDHTAIVEDKSSSPVVLISRDFPPSIMGKRTKKTLTPAQYLVLGALENAWPNALKHSDMINICGDAVNVLRRLAKSDPNWAAVIKLPGQTRTGYRLRWPSPDDVLPEANIEREWHADASPQQPIAMPGTVP